MPEKDSSNDNYTIWRWSATEIAMRIDRQLFQIWMVVVCVCVCVCVCVYATLKCIASLPVASKKNWYVCIKDRNVTYALLASRWSWDMHASNLSHTASARRARARISSPQWTSNIPSRTTCTAGINSVNKEIARQKIHNQIFSLANMFKINGHTAHLKINGMPVTAIHTCIYEQWFIT